MLDARDGARPALPDQEGLESQPEREEVRLEGDADACQRAENGGSSGAPDGAPLGPHGHGEGVRQRQQHCEVLPLPELHPWQRDEREHEDEQQRVPGQAAIFAQELAEQWCGQQERGPGEPQHEEPEDRDVPDPRDPRDQLHDHAEEDDERRVDLDDVHIQRCAVQGAAGYVEQPCHVVIGREGEGTVSPVEEQRTREGEGQGFGVAAVHRARPTGGPRRVRFTERGGLRRGHGMSDGLRRARPVRAPVRSVVAHGSLALL